MLEKLLYFYEESFPYEFHLLDNAKDRLRLLEYASSPFNQIFFRALLKFIVILTKRACYKAAFEFTKLLLRISPVEDPVGALMLIDHTALSAGRYDWFIDFARLFGKHYFGQRFSVLLFPNTLYSFALALFRQQSREITSDSIAAFIEPLPPATFERLLSFNWDSECLDFNFWLALGILLYPEMLGMIVTATDMHKQNPKGNKWVGSQNLEWSVLLQKPLFKPRLAAEASYPFLNIDAPEDTEGVAKAVSIYSERNRLLWKDRNVNLWLKSIAGQLADFAEAHPDRMEQFRNEVVSLPVDKMGFLQHLWLPFQPRKYRNLLTKDFSDHEDQIDEAGLAEQELAQAQAHGGHQQMNMNQNWFALLLNGLLPWNNIPQHRQDDPDD
jgi:hypothetical protein